MRVLHAFVSQEHYNNWCSVNTPSVEAFIREFGTPLITYDSTNMDGFVRIVEGSYIRINYNYYNDLAAWANPAKDVSSPTSSATSEVYSNVENVYRIISTQFNSFMERLRKSTYNTDN